MTATPLPVPAAPAGPPASGTLVSSTPTPQQLTGTKSKERRSLRAGFVAERMIRASFPRQKSRSDFSRLARVSLPGALLPGDTTPYSGGKGGGGRLAWATHARFLSHAVKHVKCQVSPKFRYVTAAYVYPRRADTNTAPVCIHTWTANPNHRIMTCVRIYGERERERKPAVFCMASL